MVGVAGVPLPALEVRGQGSGVWNQGERLGKGGGVAAAHRRSIRDKRHTACATSRLPADLPSDLMLRAIPLAKSTPCFLLSPSS